MQTIHVGNVVRCRKTWCKRGWLWSSLVKTGEFLEKVVGLYRINFDRGSSVVNLVGKWIAVEKTGVNLVGSGESGVIFGWTYRKLV